jgi:hypothetical protein
MSKRGGVFTDYLHVTVPYDQSGGLAMAVLDACGHGGVLERAGVPGLYDMYGGAGTLLILRRGQVVIVGISGGAIKCMRDLRVFNDVLWALAGFPHRVTKIDAAYDVAVEAPPILEEVYQAFKATGVYLGKRAAPVSKTGWKVGVSGEETGTVYVGGRKAELRAKVYDKRQEQIDKASGDLGPRVRYELTVTNKAAAISLRDAADPTALFWHYMGGRLLLRRPPGIPDWEPGGIGFALPRRPEALPAEKLKRYIEGARDTFRRGLALADACGPYGRGLMWMLVQKGNADSGEVRHVASDQHSP